MLRKIFRIFIRDIKSTKREPIAIYIVFAPTLLAIAITLFFFWRWTSAAARAEVTSA